jgi:hypothetical protein
MTITRPGVTCYAGSILIRTPSDDQRAVLIRKIAVKVLQCSHPRKGPREAGYQNPVK